MMRNLMSAVVIAGALVVPFAGGCEETRSEQKETKVKEDGTVIRKSETVKENSDGSVTKTEQRTVDRPDDKDGEVKIKIDND